jgi:hypothetical protein
VAGAIAAVGARADNFLRMFAPPEKINRAGNQDEKNQPAKSAAAFFASGVKRLEIWLARHEMEFVFRVSSFKSASFPRNALVLEFLR